MRNRILGLAIGAMALLGAGIAGASLAGGGSELPAEREAAPAVLDPVTALARGTGERARKARKKNGHTIDFLYARNPTIPPENGSVVQAIRCPRRAGNPIGGGARTSQGIVIAYLSRAHPSTARRPPRTYYVGVEDVTDANPPNSGALVEVQCAKGMRVKP